jgi:hypothetical protein
MILIAHRGNVDGPNPDRENHPDYIREAIKAGYDVEIDVWYVDGKLFLGHDNPLYDFPVDVFHSDKIWVHAKNGEAFYKLSNYTNIHTFYHTDEDWVLTTKKYIWTYPGKQLLGRNCICVLPELGFEGALEFCAGICSDYISNWREKHWPL